MSGKVIVLVSDLDDAKHGEISIVENAQKAARLVETLLEAGFEQERIRIFDGTEMTMHVTHRPVVALTGPGLDEEDRPARRTERAQMEDTTTEARGEPEGVAPEAKAELREEAAAIPFVRDGVRFSSLFRPA